MALNYTTDAGTMTIPSAGVSSITVATSNSGLSTNGVLMLVGEADAGPRFDAEASLQDNAYGPDEISAIVAKYGSGPLVDACIQAANPSNDPNIVGGPALIIPVKTNQSTKAKASLSLFGGGSYGVSIADKSYGKNGNLINFQIIQKTAEVAPTTGAFTLLVPNAAISAEVRANGGAAQPLNLTQGELPSAIVTAIGALTGLAASGGVNRSVLATITGNLTVTVVSGNQITVAYTGTWGTVPSIGDTLYIPTGSAVAGTSTAGSYVVTAATSNSISATKLLNVGGAVGSITAPDGHVSVAVAATTDVQVFSPVTVTLAASNPVTGAGKALELAEVTAGGLGSLAYALSTVKVAWVSASGAPKLLTSASEYVATLNTNRAKDNIQESLSAGGEIALKVGYAGTSGDARHRRHNATFTVAAERGHELQRGPGGLPDHPGPGDLHRHPGRLHCRRGHCDPRSAPDHHARQRDHGHRVQLRR
jgi:hypothetical protein